MTQKELTKDVEHAIKWLMDEFFYLKILDRNLRKIENESLEDQEKELKRDKHQPVP